MSPTQRTLARLRELGYLAAVVEKWNPHARIRQDLFGFVDILAIREGEVLAVQATSGSNVSARVNKITGSVSLTVIRAAGWRVEVHGWSKNSAGRVVLRVVDLTSEEA